MFRLKIDGLKVNLLSGNKVEKKPQKVTIPVVHVVSTSLNRGLSLIAFN